MLEVERRDDVQTIRIAHGKANALDLELVEALRAELRTDARAVVLTGSGTIFCAGVDLHRLAEGGAVYVRQFYPALCSFLRELFEIPIPVVIAANGHAIAGGGLMIMAGDYRVMSQGKGRVGIPELLVGVPFPVVALEVVRFAVRPDQLQSLVYTGKTLVPDDALAAGLVDEVMAEAELMKRAHDVALQMTRIPAGNFAATKRALRVSTLERIDSLSDERTFQMWLAPQTHSLIRDYLQGLKK